MFQCGARVSFVKIIREAEYAEAHLHQAIEELLRYSSTLLHPGLFFTPAEELGRLNNTDRGIDQVRDSLTQEVCPRAEVRIEDRDGLP